MAASSSDLPTEAGPKASSKASRRSAPTADHVDAISQMFTELELAYHNQFHKAFGTTEQVIMAQQLWLDALGDLPANRLIIGSRRAIKESGYLPTLHSMRSFCDPTPAELGLPDAYNAYLQACRAASPKLEQHWEHPAVYLAGKASDWFFLAGSIEAKAFPVFKRNYEILCERVLNGESLTLALPKAIPASLSTPLTNAQRKERLQTLRQQLDI